MTRLTYHARPHWHTRLTPLPAPRPWRRWLGRGVAGVAIVGAAMLLAIGCGRVE